MSLSLVKTTGSYQEALQATGPLFDSSGVGFSEKSAGVSSAVQVQQTNTILYLLLKIEQKLLHLEEEVSRLKEGLAGSSTVAVDIDKLASKISALRISEGPVIKATTGKLRVFADPYKAQEEVRKQFAK
ncbi:ORF2 [Agave badnavirus A]|nr:ORF2 [Agave badnavirus A]